MLLNGKHASIESVVKYRRETKVGIQRRARRNLMQATKWDSRVQRSDQGFFDSRSYVRKVNQPCSIKFDCVYPESQVQGRNQILAYAQAIFAYILTNLHRLVIVRDAMIFGRTILQANYLLSETNVVDDFAVPTITIERAVLCHCLWAVASVVAPCLQPWSSAWNVGSVCPSIGQQLLARML